MKFATKPIQHYPPPGVQPRFQSCGSNSLV